jgi:ribose-phosphate pyrophosphokinase
MAKALGIPLINAWKTRDVATGNISGFGCSPLGEAKKVLIVDDICDGGGTFLGLKGILPADVKCDIFVTHGIFSKGTKSLLSAFDTVFCTDSTVQCQQDGVNVIDVCETLSSFA